LLSGNISGDTILGGILNAGLAAGAAAGRAGSWAAEVTAIKKRIVTNVTNKELEVFFILCGLLILKCCSIYI